MTTRQTLILDQLKDGNKIAVKELAHSLQLTEQVLRRDLKGLELLSLVKRNYGYVELYPNANLVSVDEENLAKTALTYIHSGQVIILLHGNVNSEIIRQIPLNIRITVLSNSPQIARLCHEKQNIHFIMLGGAYSQDLHCYCGWLTDNALKTFRADLIFLEPSGIDEGRHLLFPDMDLVSLWTMGVKIARRTFALLSPNTLVSPRGVKAILLEQIDQIITTEPISCELTKQCDQANVLYSVSKE